MLNLILEGGKKRKAQCSGKASFQPAEVHCLTLESAGPESIKSCTALTSSGGFVFKHPSQRIFLGSYSLGHGVLVAFATVATIKNILATT